MKKHLKFVLLLVGLLALDLITKYIFFNLNYGSGWLVIHPIFNLGISWSLNVPILVSIFVGWISILLFIIVYNQKYITRFIAACLLAGAIGNLGDRLIFGGVRDFIYIGNRFPIFNVADICLNGGILFYLIQEIFPGKNKSKQ